MLGGVASAYELLCENFRKIQIFNFPSKLISLLGTWIDAGPLHPPGCSFQACTKRCRPLGRRDRPAGQFRYCNFKFRYFVIILIRLNGTPNLIESDMASVTIRRALVGAVRKSGMKAIQRTHVV